MEGLPSVVFISGSKTTDGIFHGNHQVYEMVRDLGARARWIQCIDPSEAQEHFRGGETVWGWRFPSRVLEMGVNRLWIFPHRLRNLPEDRLYIGDPTLLPVVDSGRSSRVVATVHDLRPLTVHGDRLSARWMFRMVFPRLSRVRRIRVYTQHLREQLEDHRGLRGLVYVLPPYSSTPIDVGQEHAKLAEGRIRQNNQVNVLYVATDRPYKNLRFYLDLAQALRDWTHPRFRFVLVSRLRPETSREIERWRLPNLTVVPFVTDIESAYRESDLLVFPSLYEGFGLPVLEAMAHGMPVLSNNQEPMREVLGAGGTLLPPGDLAAWAEHLIKLSQGGSYSQASARALERAQYFSRERFAERTPGLFE